jgi:hypothetical protein
LPCSIIQLWVEANGHVDAMRKAYLALVVVVAWVMLAGTGAPVILQELSDASDCGLKRLIVAHQFSVALLPVAPAAGRLRADRVLSAVELRFQLLDAQASGVQLAQGQADFPE